MRKYWSELVKNTEPYVPGEQANNKKYIKLNTNENPYPPSLKVIEAIKNNVDNKLRLYPDPSCQELKKIISGYYGIKSKEVFVGNGSDEVLAFSFMAFFNPGKEILFPNITYSFYPVYAKIFNINYKTVRLNKDFSLPFEEFFKSNGGIIFPNPNAPTGKDLPLSSIKKILKKNINNIVIIDEAYIDFGGESAVGLVEDFPNLIVLQTFSKSRSLAGLRVGFALGQKHLIEALARIKNSFNSYTLDRLALKGAIEAIKDNKYFEKTRYKIIKTREKVSAKLRKMGFDVIGSKANFIFISPPDKNAEDLFKKLKENGILVRYFNQKEIKDYLRVSIGTDQEMDSFIKTLENF